MPTKSEPSVRYVKAGAATTTFPSCETDASEAYAYAKGQWANDEYAEAARWFESAASSFTENGEWEFENYLNATVCWLEAGDANRARSALRKAKNTNVYAPSSQRERYLSALLLNEPSNLLSPALRASLPKSN